jgi:hypothetical protein
VSEEPNHTTAKKPGPLLIINSKTVKIIYFQLGQFTENNIDDEMAYQGAIYGCQ